MDRRTPAPSEPDLSMEGRAQSRRRHSTNEPGSGASPPGHQTSPSLRERMIAPNSFVDPVSDGGMGRPDPVWLGDPKPGKTRLECVFRNGRGAQLPGFLLQLPP
jgi:hypothetical protein